MSAIDPSRTSSKQQCFPARKTLLGKQEYDGAQNLCDWADASGAKQ